jgi:transposase InsO family protein
MFKIIILTVIAGLKSRRQLALENIALRHQLEVRQRNARRPSLRPSDRALWALLKGFLPDWRPHLSIVQPDTVIRNHMAEIVATDFFTVPTATFRTLYVFLVLSLDRRRIVHYNLTSSPTAEWTSLQLIQAFPFDTAPPYLIRERDGVYGQKVMDALDFLDIEQIVTAPRSPWQNGYCERVIGTIRRECLDHLTVLGEKHLQQVLKEYLAYYHRSRTHRGLVDRYMSDSHLRQEIDNVEGRFPERTDVLPLKYLRSESVATTTQACVNSGWIKWEGQRYREFTYSSFLSSIFVFPWQCAGPLSVVPSCLCLYFPCHPYLFLLA